MIGNYMWDPRTNKSFDIGVNQDSRMPLWWNGSEPLWITLMKARRKVCMYYWPGEGAGLQAPPLSQTSNTMESAQEHKAESFKDHALVERREFYLRTMF